MVGTSFFDVCDPMLASLFALSRLSSVQCCHFELFHLMSGRQAFVQTEIDTMELSKWMDDWLSRRSENDQWNPCSLAFLVNDATSFPYHDR